MRVVGLPIAPPAKITSFPTPTVYLVDVGELAYSTADAVRPPLFAPEPLPVLLLNNILVTMEFGRSWRFPRGGSESMYAERA